MLGRGAGRIEVGDRIAPFALPGADGEVVTSEGLLGRGPLVLYFYPKDETPGCTAEACAFRDSYEVFADAGAEVVGISADSPGSHRAFAANHRLPFLLLSDTGNAVRRAFGVPRTLGLIPGRVTYVVDREGVVQHVFNSQMHALRHVEEALLVVRRLAAAREP